MPWLDALTRAMRAPRVSHRSGAVGGICRCHALLWQTFLPGGGRPAPPRRRRDAFPGAPPQTLKVTRCTPHVAEAAAHLSCLLGKPIHPRKSPHFFLESGGAGGILFFLPGKGRNNVPSDWVVPAGLTFRAS